MLLWGLLSFIIGIMFLTTPGITTLILITFMGAYWLVGGFFTLGSLFVDKTNMGLKIFLSVVNILAGIIILAYPLYSTVFILAFFAIFIGFWGCFIGAAHLFQAFKTKDAGNACAGNNQPDLWSHYPDLPLLCSRTHTLYRRRVCSGERYCSGYCSVPGKESLCLSCSRITRLFPFFFLTR